MTIYLNRAPNGWCDPFRREVSSFKSFNVDGVSPLTQEDVARFALDDEITTVAHGVIWKETFKPVLGEGSGLARVYAVKQTSGCEVEADIMAGLDHPNIIKPEAMWQANDSWCFAMPYYPLDAAKLMNRGTLEIGQALYIFRELADVLKYLHKVRVVHADIKSGNILLSSGFDGGVFPEVKLCDFGIARSTGEKVDGELRGNVVGTPEYISPERWTGKIPDEREDIYGAGCTAYELLGGFIAVEESLNSYRLAVDNRKNMAEFSDAGEGIRMLLSNMVSERGYIRNGKNLVRYLKKHFPTTP